MKQPTRFALKKFFLIIISSGWILKFFQKLKEYGKKERKELESASKDRVLNTAFFKIVGRMSGAKTATLAWFAIVGLQTYLMINPRQYNIEEQQTNNAGVLVPGSMWPSRPFSASPLRPSPCGARRWPCSRPAATQGNSVLYVYTIFKFWRFLSVFIHSKLYVFFIRVNWMFRLDPN